MEHSFGQFASAVHIVSIPEFLATLNLLTARTEWEIVNCATFAQQYSNQWCALNTVLAKNPNRQDWISIIKAAAKEIISTRLNQANEIS